MSWFRNLFKSKKPTKLCPNCNPGPGFPNNAILQLCRKCTADGYEYHMFYDTTKGESFYVVSLTVPQRLPTNARNNPHGNRSSPSPSAGTPARPVGQV